MLRFHDGAIECPDCKFNVTGEEIAAIQAEFAPAMDKAMAIFLKWREDRRSPADKVLEAIALKRDEFNAALAGRKDGESASWKFTTDVIAILEGEES